MSRLIKFLLFVLVLALIGLTGYAYLADLKPKTQEVRVPVQLNAD